ncbi:hypothetical protein [Halalkalibacter oceani]|uniref:hypothetical protein n=1 Tax=Halalkalibacter oceani TaxID=1653776 RepID=UPI0033944685
MYDLCVIRDVVPTEGASELEVPKKTFNYWRNSFRFGPYQQRSDQAGKFREKEIIGYKNELDNIDLDREFMFNHTKSLDGLKEIIERFLELEKLKRTKVEKESMDELSVIMEIKTLESTLEYIKKYTSGNLYQEFVKELNYLKEK